jgi:hypothetical protein
MKIENLYKCLRSSWCIEKHWEPIIKILLIAKRVTKSKELKQAIEDLENIHHETHPGCQ